MQTREMVAVQSIGGLSIMINRKEKEYWKISKSKKMKLVQRQLLTGLRQKLSPNKAQTSFMSSKYVTVEGQPVKKSIRHSCSKGFQSFSKGI
jgi:hypothetical protein